MSSEKKNPAWQAAIRKAKYDYEHAHLTDLSHAEIGRRMGRLLKRKAFSRQSVGLWFKGTRPEPQNFVALARVLEIPEAEIPALLEALAASPPPVEAAWTGVDSEAYEEEIRADSEEKRKGERGA